MEVKELKKRYEIEEYVTTKDCIGKLGERWFVLPAEMTAIDAIKIVANKLHVSTDKVVETRGHLINGKLYTRKSWEKVPKGAQNVWAMSLRR